MKKAFKFIESLKRTFFDLMGYPTIKMYSDYTEVYFDCKSVIRSFEPLELDGYDEMRFFAGDGCITFVFTFYHEEDIEK